MRITPAFLVAASLLTLTRARADEILVENDRHIVRISYPIVGLVVISMEAIDKETDDLRGEFPNVDFAHIQADVNINGVVDEGIDVGFGTAVGTVDELCAQYLATNNSAMPCSSFPSKAGVRVAFEGTLKHPTPHPIWEFFIPIRELSRNGLSALLVFQFHDAGRGYTRYPKTKTANLTFSSAMKVRLQDPHALATLLVGGSPPARTAEVLRNDRHVITATRSLDRIVFKLEAIDDTTDHRQGSFPRIDFANLRADVNQNGRVDERVDVSYSLANESICTQYLLTDTSSTDCGGFRSGASLDTKFGATENGRAPHPVWEFSIPMRELGSSGTSAHLVFNFHDAEQGYTRYPAADRANVTFSKAVDLDFTLLTARIVPGETGPEAETVQHDVTPPELILTNPAVAPNGILVHGSDTVRIQGKAKDDRGVFQVLVNDEEASVSREREFSHEVRLAYGENPILVRARDLHDNWAELRITVVRESLGNRGVEIPVEERVELSETRYRALLIAVQNYNDPQVDLLHPLSDAIDLREVLIQRYRFEPEDVTLLPDPDEDTVIASLKRLTESAAPTDHVLIFFAGHGQWDEQAEEGFWLPIDASSDNPANWISNADIKRSLKRFRSRHVLLVADACFAGSVFRTMRNGEAEPDRSISELDRLPSRKAMTSGALTQVPDGSVFVEYLVKRLRENESGFITAGQLFHSFQSAVINNAPNVPQYGVVFDTGDEGGEFVFVLRN